jgi:hypothetical protein
MKNQSFYSQLATAYAQSLTDEMSADAPRIQLDAQEIETLVSILAACAAPLQANKATLVPERKRALSAYQCWKSNPQVKSKFRQDYPGSNGPATNKQMGLLWKALTPEERQPFEEQNAKLKEEFAAAHPEGEAPPKKTRTNKPNETKKPKCRTGYQHFKMDEGVRKALKLEMPDAEEGSSYFATFSKALSAKWKTLTTEEQQPYLEKAATEKAAVAAIKAAPVVVQQVISTAVTLMTTPPSSDSDEAQTGDTTEPSVTPETSPTAKSKKRGPTPYQIWKKTPANKEAFISSFPESDTKELGRLMKDAWKGATDEQRSQGTVPVCEGGG